MSETKTKHIQAQIEAYSERRAQVLRLRKEGWTFRRIAAELRISPARVAQIHRRGLELEEDRRATIRAEQITPLTPVRTLPLSTRARRALGFGGYVTFAQLVPLDDAKERELLALSNLDRVGLRDLAAVVAAATMPQG